MTNSPSLTGFVLKNSFILSDIFFFLVQVLSLYQALVRLKVVGPPARQTLLQLCGVPQGGQGDICRPCYSKIREEKRRLPTKDIREVWESAKKRRRNQSLD